MPPPKEEKNKRSDNCREVGDEATCFIFGQAGNLGPGGGDA